MKISQAFKLDRRGLHRVVYKDRDVFRYVFKGVEIDWWDWGDSSDHEETIVKLPCFINGRVVDPKDNGGRPKLIVPASNSIEFTIV